MESIELVKLPVVNHNIKKDSEALDKYIKELDLENQIASSDTVAFLKGERAACNKESAGVRLTLKTFIDAVSIPIVKIKNDVKSELLEKYEKLDGEFKTKIATVENAVKDKKKKELEIYFGELCVNEKIDFVKFDQLQLNFKLGNTETILKKQANEFIVKVSNDLKLIDSEKEHSIEMLVEYKKTLNSSKAIMDVRARKESEKQAKIRAEQIKWDKRKSSLLGIAMIHNSTLKVFEFNETILVFEDKVRACTDDEFTALVQEYKTKIAEYLESKKPDPAVPNMGTLPPKEVKKQAPAPIQKPVEVEEEMEASFKVKATITKLKALIKYMKENGIKYEDI